MADSPAVRERNSADSSPLRSPATRWHALADDVLSGAAPSHQQALDILNAPDDAVLELLAAAYRIRRHYYGNTVKLNYLVNAKSGLCPEDCGYCSQSRLSTASIHKYPLMDADEIIEGAEQAVAMKASTCCIVLSGRGPSNKEVRRVAEATRTIKERHPGLKICACMGLLRDGQAEELKEAGVDRYNHNVNTASSHHDEVVSTHTYDDRVETVEKAKHAGISPCSGVIIGMGETDEQIVEAAFALRSLGSDSIPVNFLIPIEGTPMELRQRAHQQKNGANNDGRKHSADGAAAKNGHRAPDTAAGHGRRAADITPRFALKVLAMYRFVCPDREIRVSAGREVHLRSLQPMAFYAANALFVSDYLTEPGQTSESDWEMIEDLGFEIETVGEGPLTPAGDGASSGDGAPAVDNDSIRP